MAQPSSGAQPQQMLTPPLATPQPQPQAQPQPVNLVPPQQQQAAALGAFAPMRSMFNSWPLPGAFGGMQNLMGVPGFGGMGVVGGGGSGAATPSWAGNAQAAAPFINPFLTLQQQQQQQQLPAQALQQAQPVLVPVAPQQQQAAGAGASPAPGFVTGRFGSMPAGGWGAPQPQAAAAELQTVLGRYAQAGDGMSHQQPAPQPQQQHQQPPQLQHHQQPQPQQSQGLVTTMQAASQFGQPQQQPPQGQQFATVLGGLNAASASSDFSHASDPPQPAADGTAHAALLPPLDALQQHHQQGQMAHLQQQHQQTSHAPAAGIDFASVSFNLGAGNAAYQSPFLTAAAPAASDVPMGDAVAMPPTSEGTIEVASLPVSPLLHLQSASVKLVVSRRHSNSESSVVASLVALPSCMLMQCCNRRTWWGR